MKKKEEIIENVNFIKFPDARSHLTRVRDFTVKKKIHRSVPGAELINSASQLMW